MKASAEDLAAAARDYAEARRSLRDHRALVAKFAKEGSDTEVALKSIEAARAVWEHVSEVRSRLLELAENF